MVLRASVGESGAQALPWGDSEADEEVYID